MRRLVVAAVMLCSIALQAQTFRPEAIKGDMSFLASDLLEGREAGTRGFDVAAGYVSAQFEAAGLLPGADGGWLQAVPFRQTTVVDAQMTLRVAGREPRTMAYADGFLVNGNPLQPETRLSGDVVFAGYGISAPEARYDDYVKLDAKGKIVAIVNGAPASFSPTQRAHYASSVTKLETAVANGAIGIILLRTPSQYGRDVWERNVAYARKGAMHWLRADGTPRGIAPEAPFSISVSGEIARMLFERSGQTFEKAVDRLVKGKARRGRLKASLDLVVKSQSTPVQSANVVGILPGSDPQVANEHIVVTSHLDHVGIGDPVDGDAIHNGAIDNASGVAIVLEAARALVAAKPRRSIVFVATTGEEKGLRGADYYANNPTVKVGPIVANINIDQVYLFAPTRDVTVIGAEHSDLGDSAKRVAGAMGLELSPDPFPQAVVFVRSDQYPFVRKGIPAVFPIAGYKAVDASIDLQKLQSEWDDKRYHQPSDDMSQPIDFRAAAQMAEFTYRMVLDVANGAKRPQWKPGDFFGEKFGK